MKKSLFLLFAASSLIVLSACGGGNSTPPPPPAATHLSVTAPTNATAGTSFNFAVTALDASNNVVSSYSGSVHFTSTDGQAGLPANSMLTNGTGTFSPTLKTIGGQTITATDTVKTSITGTSNLITVTGVAAATHFSVTAPATATPGTSFNFTVTALDGTNSATGYAGTAHFTSTDGQAVLPANSTLTNGIATFSVTLKTPGSQTITATDTSTAIAGTSKSIVVAGPPATHFSVTAPASATAGTAFNFVVTALDAMNNAASGYSAIVHFASTDAHADLPVDSMLMNGTATFSAALSTMGSQTITATDSVNPTIAGTSKSINISTAVPANPVPFINQPLNPDAVIPGATDVKLTVNGTGFVAGSTVKLNGNARATSVISNSELTATALATNISTFNTASVTVVNPAPGGGISNVVFFETTRPTSSVALSVTSELIAGSGPISVATGDFNGDGKLDLTVANNGTSNDIDVFLGKGDGTFQPAASYGAGAGPYAVAVGDFNGDGKLDLAVANTGSNNVSVLLGKGDGTFQPSVEYSVGSDPRSLAVGDFNGDGKLDIVVANSGASTGISGISVLLGKGDGTFEPALNYSVGSAPVSVVVGDLNGDGRLDLAIVNFGTSNVGVLLGNGDGTFQPPVNYAAGAVPVAVVVGDYNGDGKLDLAVATISPGNTGLSNLSVLLGNGDGTFQQAAQYSDGSDTDSSSVVQGDFNGDGKLDLAVAGGGSIGNVSILLGNGDGTFQSAAEYAIGSNPSSAAVGDFNGDGRLDMAVTSGPEGVSILLQPGLVSNSNAFLSPSSLTFPTQVVNTTSAAQTVRLTNYGTTMLSIAGIAVTNNFGKTDSCGMSLAAGASCTIGVTFTPNTFGNLNGTLSVTDDAPGSPHTVSLSGTGTAVMLSVTNLRFGCVLLNAGPMGVHCFCTPPLHTTLTNSGNTPLNITGITITGPFSQTNTCPTSLGAGQSCDIAVSWSHSTGGGVLSISDSGGGSPQTIPLFGFASCHPSASSNTEVAPRSATCGGR